jgi:hypothetical protein
MTAVGVAASGSYPPTRSLASNRRRGRRIRSGRLRPNIESVDEAHRVRAQAAAGRLTADERPIRQKAGEDDGKSDISRNRTLHSVPQKPGACTPRPGTAVCVASNRPLTTPNQLRDSENSPQRLGVAHAVPTAEPSVCHQDHKARKHAPKRAVRDIGRSRAMPAKRRRLQMASA